MAGKFETIYRDMKQKIEENTWPSGELLPSEHQLCEVYGCSRNTLRRAIALLAKNGYVQTIRGKGSRNIWQPDSGLFFALGTIESFSESAAKNNRRPSTRVILFTEIRVDESLHRRTGFEIGTELYYIQRIHSLDGEPWILNHNFFRKDIARGLTADIAERSVYRYLEDTLGIQIINSRRTITVEKVTQLDEKYLKLNVEDYNCMVVVTGRTYNADGIMFEYTESRHRPDRFCFSDNAIRHSPEALQ